VLESCQFWGNNFEYIEFTDINRQFIINLLKIIINHIIKYQKDCIDKLHPLIQKLNWIYIRDAEDDFETAVAQLLALMQHHQDYVQQHTELLIKALNWERHHQSTSYLLRGSEREQAELWL